MQRLKKHPTATRFFNESTVHGDIRVPELSALWR
jgi:hypothetical protein